MDNKIKVTFWLYTAKKNQKKLTPIYMRVWNNYEYFNKSTGLFVKHSDWDKKTMRVKGISQEAASLNAQMEAIRHNVIQITNQLTITGKPFNVEMVKKKLDGTEEHQMTVMKVYEEHLLIMKRMLGKEYTKATLTKYKNTHLRLTQYLKHRHKRNDMFLYELNYDFMKGFEIFLRERFDNSTTTCYKHYQRFTRVLNIAIQKGYLKRHPFPTYKIRVPKKKIEYLDQAELDRMEQIECKVERLNTIKDIFIFCCYSGLAYTEVENLSPDDITVGMDGENWMNILRRKTQKHYQVPILPKAQEIINKYQQHPKCIKKNKVLPVPSNVKYNAYLKEIANLASIRKHLTTHIARKTFATTVMLANGVNIGVLSKLLGHASVQVTLDSYGTFHDQLMLSNVKMVRDKFIDQDDAIKVYEIVSAQDDLVQKFRTITTNN